MKYLCLIYDNEQEWQKFPKDVQDKYMSEYTAFSEGTQEPERRFISRRLDELRLTSSR